MIGDSALKTVKRGGEPLDKGYKESMPKDAYAMWNKLQKSLIGTVTGEKLDCTFCGECVAVCPVGALVASNFKYKANAWELKRIPSSCSHCSSACSLFYEIKHQSSDNSAMSIYRVKNDYEFSTLCGGGRFGYDFQNDADKDETAFKAALKRLGMPIRLDLAHL